LNLIREKVVRAIEILKEEKIDLWLTGKGGSALQQSDNSTNRNNRSVKNARTMLK